MDEVGLVEDESERKEEETSTAETFSGGIQYHSSLVTRDTQYSFDIDEIQPTPR